MKEKFNRTADNATSLPGKTGNAIEHVSDNVDDNTTELRKKARKTEILEEVKEKLGISTKKKENLLQKAGHVLNQAKDHVEVRTEQWVKDVGSGRDILVNDLGKRTNHLQEKLKKSKPFKKLKEKTGGLKKNARHTIKMVAHKVATKNQGIGRKKGSG